MANEMSSQREHVKLAAAAETAAAGGTTAPAATTGKAEVNAAEVGTATYAANGGLSRKPPATIKVSALIMKSVTVVDSLSREGEEEEEEEEEMSCVCPEYTQTRGGR